MNPFRSKKSLNRVRKNYTIRPASVRMLERLSRDMDMPMSRVLEAALDALAEKRMLKRVADDPRTWPEAQALLDSLPTMAKKGEAK